MLCCLFYTPTLFCHLPPPPQCFYYTLNKICYVNNLAQDMCVCYVTYNTHWLLYPKKWYILYPCVILKWIPTYSKSTFRMCPCYIGEYCLANGVKEDAHEIGSFVKKHKKHLDTNQEDSDLASVIACLWNDHMILRDHTDPFFLQFVSHPCFIFLHTTSMSRHFGASSLHGG